MLQPTSFRTGASPAQPAVLEPGPVRAEQPAAPADPIAEWGPVQRILFRLACSYFVLYSLPFPFGTLPYTAYVAQKYTELWNAVVPWVGERVFGLTISVQPNGSGDTTYNYVQVFCFLILALAATVVWTLADLRRRHYTRLHEWLRIYLRFSLATVMIVYGAMKVIKSQFPNPSLDRLLQPYGDSSPMGLLWTLMGLSVGYNIYTGAAEMIGGLLLTTRRTTLLGALVSAAVMSNVAALNFFYDVPVKLFSLHLVAIALFLAVPDLRRLADFFVFNRPVPPAVLGPLFRRRWLDRGALALRTLAVLGFTVLSLYQAEQGRKMYGDGSPRSPLYGIWEVERFETDGVVRPPLVTDATRWRRVVFDYPLFGAVQLMDDSRQRFMVKIDERKRTLELTRRNEPGWKATLSYWRIEPEVLDLHGTFEGRKVRALARRKDASDFLLVNRGFHWVNEYPFNR